MVKNTDMNMFEFSKKIRNGVNYYDEISPKPFTKGYAFNPFSTPKQIKIVWINKDNEFDNWCK